MASRPGVKASVVVFVTMTLADEHHFQVTKVAPGYGEGRRIGEFIPFVGSMPEGTAIAKAVTYRLRFEEEQERAGDRFTAHCIQSIGGTEIGGDLLLFPSTDRSSAPRRLRRGGSVRTRGPGHRGARQPAQLGVSVRR